MKYGKFLAVILLLILVVGFARGWFGFSAKRDRGDEKLKVEFTVDTNRVQGDAERVEDKAANVGEKVNDEIHDATGR